MHDAVLPAAYVLKIRHAMAVIQGNVRIKTGVKTENAQFPKKFHIAMSVMKNAEILSIYLIEIWLYLQPVLIYSISVSTSSKSS